MNEEPIEVEHWTPVPGGPTLVIRHFAPHHDSITYDEVHFAAGPSLRIARVGPHGYAVHEPLVPGLADNRAGRRAERSKKRGRR